MRVEKKEYNIFFFSHNPYLETLFDWLVFDFYDVRCTASVSNYSLVDSNMRSWLPILLARTSNYRGNWL
jgi:hypothetical protein